MNGNDRELGSGHPAKAPEVEPFINKDELGRRTGMRPRTIDAWIHNGRLPYYKLGRSVRFRWSEVEQHLMKKCRVAAGE